MVGQHPTFDGPDQSSQPGQVHQHLFGPKDFADMVQNGIISSQPATNENSSKISADAFLEPKQERDAVNHGRAISWQR